MKNLLFKGLFLMCMTMVMFSCNSDDDVTMHDDTQFYDIPSSYNFDNVSYQGQTDRLAMMTEWKSYMASSRTSGIALDAARMKAMFTNEAGAEFTQEYTKQIKSKTFEAVQADFDALIDELAAASTSTVAGEVGVSGVIESLDGAKSYLVGDDGLDHAQVIEKGLMGACFYYQGTTIYLGSDRMNVDNETVEEGKGTEMEHHWDESFGYFGVPKDFPANTDILSFWGSYSNSRNAVLSSNQAMMSAFLEGRAAISNKDLETRDEAIAEIRAEWEKIAVGSILHYLNSGIENFEDMALRSHSVSEAIGFLYSLQFNEGKIIETTKVNELLTIIAGSANFDEMNLYNTTVGNLQTVKDELAAIYGLESVMNDF